MNVRLKGRLGPRALLGNRVAWVKTPDGVRLSISPLPPLANRLWRRGWTRGRVPRPITYKTAEAKNWQRTMAILLRPLLDAYRTARGDLFLRCWLYFPDARRRDCDAPVKLLMDTVALALGINDQRFLPQVMGRTMDRGHPRVEVTLEPAP